MKKIALVSVIFTSALILAGCTNNNSPNVNPDNNTNSPQSNKQDTGSPYTINSGELVLFWGQGCPHCENIDKFLEENKDLADKLKLRKIEAFNDMKGQKIFLEKVKECKLSTAGVPVLYKDGKCTQGDAPIIEELKKVQ